MCRELKYSSSVLIPEGSVRAALFLPRSPELRPGVGVGVARLAEADPLLAKRSCTWLSM